MASASRRILAFDCSGASCSAAVLVEGEIRSARFAAMERGQAEALLPQIRDVMAEARLRFGEIDAIATTVGPGSFTGLRIGLAAARGLSLAARRPILALTSFEALVASVADADHRSIVAAIDSRRGPVFTQIFDSARSPAGLPASVEASAAASWLPTGRTLVVGDGTTPFRTSTRSDVDLRPAQIDARDVARAASLLDDDAPRRALPLYLRPPDVTTPKTR